MLTTAQVDHFRTFGFTVLSGYLADRVDALRAEVDAVIRDAYAAPYDERVIDGISGHYLPMASRLTPVISPNAPKGSCTSPRRGGTPTMASACVGPSSLSTSMS